MASAPPKQISSYANGCCTRPGYAGRQPLLGENNLVPGAAGCGVTRVRELTTSMEPTLLMHHAVLLRLPLDAMLLAND